MDNKRKCLCSAYGLEREGASARQEGMLCKTGSRGEASARKPEQKKVFEREWMCGWVGGVKGVEMRQKRLCMAVCERIAKTR